MNKSNTSKISSNIGFDGRIFLHEEEWNTYLRRKPVRYIKKKKKTNCEICQKSGTQENPLQNAHKISFDMGIVQLALTPDFLDSDSNIVTAHRTECNKKAEFSFEEAKNFLVALGHKLPIFLTKILSS